ncbi:MAG: aquaporin, partial [Lachnospiraceae bacterium]|nr:aquaporin [Lachnospiraceae bacterium]
MKKYVAEFIGTFILVFIGCGTAMTVGCDANNGCGYILTAFAFGLAIVAMAYSLGNISGGHVNPAVSLAVLINGGMDAKDFVGYVVAQCLGAFAGSGLLACIFGMGGLTDKTGGLGANAAPNIPFAIVVEIVLTCIFIMTILGVTSKKQS